MTNVLPAASSVAAAFALQTFTSLPPRAGGNVGIYPFKQMTPGTAFFVPLKSETDKDTPKKLSTAASQSAKKLGMTFSVRTHIDEIGLFGPKGTVGVGVYCLRPDQADEADETPEGNAEGAAEGDGAASANAAPTENAPAATEAAAA